MLAATLLVATLSFWNEKAEAEVALEERAQEQTTVARAIADQLESRFSSIVKDAQVIAEAAQKKTAVPQAIASTYSRIDVTPARGAQPVAASGGVVSSHVRVGEHSVHLDLATTTLLSGFRRMEQRNALVLLLAPGQEQFLALDGRRVAAPFLQAALAGAQTWTRVMQPDAASLGLPRRMAVAGFSHVDLADFGHWGVAVVESAEHQRDREYRARLRLVLSVVVAAVLVFGFGMATMRQQRRQLELSAALALAQLQQERDERLARANRAATLGTIAMGIAHELSTPLSIIAGRAEQLLRASDEKIQRGAKVIIEQSDRIHRVVRAFFALARGASPANHEIKPGDVVAGAAALVEHVFAKAQVSLSQTIAPDLPSVYGDHALLEQALVNLLLNACHACTRGGHVEVGARAHDASVELYVVDDGTGISEENRVRSTELFFTTKPAGEGTGLGLAIVSEIVKNHRGRLTLLPRTPRGTRATIELPLSKQGETHEAA